MDNVKTMVWELGVFSISGITLFRNYDEQRREKEKVYCKVDNFIERIGERNLIILLVIILIFVTIFTAYQIYNLFSM